MSDNKFTLVNERKGNEKAFDTRAEAKEQKDRLIGLGMTPENLEIVPPGETATDGGPSMSDVHDGEPAPGDGGQPTPEVVESAESDGSGVVSASKELPDEQPDLTENPIDWMPSHFIDTISGTPVVNRMGYAVIASKYNVSVTAEPVTLASETDFEYAEFQATAVTESGEEYSGFGSAHVDREDGDDPELLNELSETRALKRACAWATGVGLTAVEELQAEL